MSKIKSIVEETTTLDKAGDLLGEAYETLDDVKKVIRLIQEFPMKGAVNFNFPESSHGLFVVLEHAHSLIDSSIEKINCVNKDIYILERMYVEQNRMTWHE